MAKIRSFFDALREVRVQADRIADLERELMRLSPQVAAQEARIEGLRARIEDPAFTGDDVERAEARSLVEEVRTEHARVRARISAASVFEERLRVLEAHAGIDSATGRPIGG